MQKLSDEIFALLSNVSCFKCPRQVAANVPAAACERDCGGLHCPPRRKPKRVTKVQLTTSARLQAGRELGVRHSNINFYKSLTLCG